MKHFSGIDYDHFLDDVRDMYPFSIEESILTELIANSLDAKTSLIDIRIIPEQRTFELIDNGRGMDARGFETYHNFSMSFKRKGHGIGFAGLGAKLALKIADRIVTETREQENARSRKKPFWSASEWHFERKRKAAHPVWYDLEDRALPHHGTRVRILLKSGTSLLLNPDAVRRIINTHYLPLLTISGFYETLRLYRRITVLVNGEILEAPNAATGAGIISKEIILRRGSMRKPFALARFEFHPEPLPDQMQGVAISTFGKIIKRDYLKQYFNGMERMTGLIEVPELVECLTTSKVDFMKEGAAGNKYYRFTKIAQQEFHRWLESINLVGPKEQSADKDSQRLQRLITRIVSEIPDLQLFYGFRSTHDALLKDPEGDLTGTAPESVPAPVKDTPVGGADRLVQDALERAAREGRALEPGEAVPAIRRPQNTRFGPTIRYVSSPDRSDISWMEGDTVLLNTAHPAYRKAIEKKVTEYHNLFAVALAMLRDVPTGQEKLEVLEKFMSEWGKL